jgi:hypothetical protein
MKDKNINKNKIKISIRNNIEIPKSKRRPRKIQNNNKKQQTE